MLADLLALQVVRNTDVRLSSYKFHGSTPSNGRLARTAIGTTSAPSFRIVELGNAKRPPVLLR
jgi:hypothetical protein